MRLGRLVGVISERDIVRLSNGWRRYLFGNERVRGDDQKLRRQFPLDLTCLEALELDAQR